MRKSSLVLLGAAVGASFTLVAAPPALLGTSARANANTNRQLNLFGDIFKRVRSHYVEKPDDTKLVEGAVNGMQVGLFEASTWAKSIFWSRTDSRGRHRWQSIEPQQLRPWRRSRTGSPLSAAGRWT
jgi:carboxyl-terminal processing protease